VRLQSCVRAEGLLERLEEADEFPLCRRVLALCAAAAFAQDLDDSKDNIAGPYVPTPWVIVQEMLKLADVRGEDVSTISLGRRRL